jgi:LPS O-antigen subunit length determinant protein (WzzB/FepE family)
MSDQVISTEEVRELGESLRFVAAEFEDANDTAEEYGDYVSHDDLAHELEQFAENWEITRGDLMENLTALAEAAVGAAEGVEGLEQALVDALEGDG